MVIGKIIIGDGMKKGLFLILLMICPMFVHALDLEYHVCKSGCEYTELEEVLGAMNALTGTYGNNATIYIDDAEAYELTNNNYVYNIYGWVDSIYRSRFDNISILGTKEQPKITTTSTHQDFNYNDRSIFIEAYGNIVIKNVKIEVPGSIMLGTKGNVVLDKVDIKTESLNSYFTAKENTISNMNLTGDLVLTSLSTVKDSKIDGILDLAGGLVGENLTINGHIYNYGHLNIKNTVIDAKGSDYGIVFPYNDCLGDCGSSYNYGKDSSIKDSVIKNAKDGAILYNRSNPHQKTQLRIDGTDMGSNPTSIVMYNVYSWGPNEFYDGYSVEVSNSKVSGAETYKIKHEDWGNQEIPKFAEAKALNMHFDATNTWVKPIHRVNDPSKKNSKKANIVETDKGRIVIDRKNSVLLVLNVTNDMSVEKIFEELGEVLGEVKIDDPSIVKLVDGKLVALKAGETDVTFVVENTNYIVHVKVDKVEKNPETIDAIIIALVLFVTALVVFAVNSKKLIKNRS